jgi:hypothetical protein
MNKIMIYDCGCVKSRPHKPSCKSYGTRWKVYKTPNYLILKCRDCNKKHVFEIKNDNVRLVYNEFIGRM